MMLETIVAPCAGAQQSHAPHQKPFVLSTEETDLCFERCKTIKNNTIIRKIMGKDGQKKIRKIRTNTQKIETTQINTGETPTQHKGRAATTR